MLVDLSDFHKVFLGECVGFGVSKRGPDDNHLCYTRLIEDDGNWFASKEKTSSSWLEDEQQQFDLMCQWFKESTEKGEWGYELFSN